MTTRLPAASRGPIAYVANLIRAASGRHPHTATLRHSRELETLHTLGQKQNAQSTPWLALGGAFAVGLLGLNIGQWATHQRQATVIQSAQRLLDNPAGQRQAAQAVSSTPPPPAPGVHSPSRNAWSAPSRASAVRFNNTPLIQSLRTTAPTALPIVPARPEARS